jgi:diacylglycerol kinase family enzyme
MDGRVTILANPRAGRGKASRIARALERELSSRGVILQMIAPDDPAEAPHQPPSAWIAIGGDGTVRSAVSRAVAAASGAPAPVLVVPVGTANLLASHLRLPWDASADLSNVQNIADALERGRTRDFDVPEARGEVFLLMVGVGLDAAIVRRLHAARKGPITRASYLIPAARTFPEFEFPTLSVTIDGRRLVVQQPGLLFVGNVPEYGTGFPILTRARPDDGLLDVYFMPCNSIPELTRFGMLMLAGEHVNEPGALYVRGSQIAVTSDTPCPVQVDGEPLGSTPLRIELPRRRISFIVGE